MNRWIRRGLLAASGAVLLLAAAGVAGVQLAERKQQRRVTLPAYPVKYVDDAEHRERGRYLYASRGCVDCHGADGAGRVFIDDGHMVAKGPQIAPGARSVTAGYGPADWERTIRHGVKPDGRPLLIMPSQDYNRLTDDDLAALVSHVRHLPPADGGAAELRLPLPVRVMYGFGMIPDAASVIDHTLPPQAPVPEGVNVAHGEYVAQMCKGCHGAQFAGGKVPGGPPDWPAAANLTPGQGGVMSRYPDGDALLALFRSGKRPDGSAVRVMPFESLAQLSSQDVRALRLYLGTLPAREAGTH